MSRRLRRLAGAFVVACLVLPAGGAEASGPTVTGAGSTWAGIALSQWQSDAARLGLSINYQGVGSTSGRLFFVSGQVDFAASEIPFLPDEIQNLRNEHKTYQYLPDVAGGTAFMYNLHTASGQRITNLRLSAATIAKIFTGAITNWQDPAIRADNPGLALPNEQLTPVVRSDGSGTSAKLADYMAYESPSIWKPFAAKYGVSMPVQFWPNWQGQVAVPLSNGVANYIASSTTGNGAIGYVEAGFIYQHGLTPVFVKNRSGHFAAPTSQNVGAALLHATLNHDLTQNLGGVYNAPEANAYPLASYSYLITQTSGFDRAKGAVLGKWIIYIACSGQKEAAQLGYSPLPKNLVADVFSAVRRIPGAPAPPPLTASACPNPMITGQGYGTTPQQGPTTQSGGPSTSQSGGSTTHTGGNKKHVKSGKTSKVPVSVPITSPGSQMISITPLSASAQRSAFNAAVHELSVARLASAPPLLLAAGVLALVLLVPAAALRGWRGSSSPTKSPAMRRGRRMLWLLVPLAVGMLITLAPSADAGRLTVRDSVYHTAIHVFPNSGLGNGQYARVTWSGAGPNGAVFFRQCTARPTNVANDCTGIYAVNGYSSAGGDGSAYAPVTMGRVLSEGYQQTHHTFACDRAHSCTLGVFTGGTLQSGVLAKIAFAPTAAGCPASRGAAVQGSGADPSAIALSRWELKTCMPPARLSVTYTPDTFLAQGGSNLLQGLTQFTVTGLPLDAGTRSKLKANSRTVAYAPLTESGLVLAYKVFDESGGGPTGQITSLRLTPALVAKIFTGQINNWNTDDPAIKALNPGHVFPNTVRPLVRADDSYANLLFTSWLNATARTSLPAGWKASVNYPSVLPTFCGVSGGDALAQTIANPAANAALSGDFSSFGYIGFVDSSQAAYYGLPVAQIQNPAGKFVTATPASLAAALSHAKRNADGATVTPDFASTDPAAYPMPVLDSAVVPTNTITGADGKTLAAFMRYALTKGQHSLPRGYAPLSRALVVQSLRAVKDIPQTVAPGSNPGGNGTGTGYPPAGGSSDGTPPPGGGGSSSGPPPTSSPGGSGSHGLLAATFQGAAGPLVLPALVSLGLIGILGGLALESASFRRRLQAVGRLRGVTRLLPGWLRP